MDGRKRILRLPGGFSPVVLLLPFIWIVVLVLKQGVPDNINAGDSALLELSTRNLFTGGILLGPYSRFLFFHPGPMYFWLRFPLYAISGFMNSTFLITVCLIGSASLLCLYRIIRKQLGTVSAVLFTLSGSLFLMNTDRLLWLSDWNPFVIMLPMAVYCVAAAWFATGSLKALYTMVITGSFIAQTHLGSIPTLTVIFISASAVIFFPAVAGKRKDAVPLTGWKHALLAGILLLVLWAPPLYQELSAEGRGNITSIREFFEEEKPELTLQQSIPPWAAEAVAADLSPAAARLRHMGMLGTVQLIWVGIRLVLLAAGYFYLRNAGSYRFLCTLCLVCIAAHLISLFSVTQIRGGLNCYLLSWMQVLSLLSFTSLALTAKELLKGKKPFAGRGRQIALVLFSAATAVSIYTARSVTGFIRDDIDPSWTEVITTSEIAEQAAAVLDPGFFYVFVLESHDSWPILFGVMNAMEKQGYKVAVEDSPFYIDTPVPEGMTSRRLHVGLLRPEAMALPGIVGEWQGTGIILE